MDALTDKNVINAGGSLSSKGWVPPLRMTSASVMDVLSLLTDSAWVLWRLDESSYTFLGLYVDGLEVRCVCRVSWVSVYHHCS